jgi:hypothetical protein
MSINKPTKAQYRHFDMICQGGCIVCGSPAEPHHIEITAGCKKDHDRVIPLCPTHHRTGGYGVAIHAGRAEFESKYGTEQELFIKTMERLA